MSVNPEPVVDPYRSADREERIIRELHRQFRSIDDYRRALRLWCLIEDAEHGLDVYMAILALSLGILGALLVPTVFSQADLPSVQIKLIGLAGFVIPLVLVFYANKYLVRRHFLSKLQRFLDKLPEHQKGFEARVRQIMEDCE